jgi:PAS domain S-box-containing protein
MDIDLQNTGDAAARIAQLEEELEQIKVVKARMLHDIQLLSSLLDSAPDSILIVDETGRITQVNVELEKLLGWSRGELLGKSMDVLVPERLRHMHQHQMNGYLRAPKVRPMGSGVGTAALSKSGEEIDVDIKLSPVFADGKRRVIAIMRDIRPWKRAEAERQRLTSEVEQSREESKLLSGLLPICSCCKKIRDSTDHWHMLESYITNHSEAKFSHGFCPDCERDYIKAYGL